MDFPRGGKLKCQQKRGNININSTKHDVVPSLISSNTLLLVKVRYQGKEYVPGDFIEMDINNEGDIEVVVDSSGMVGSEIQMVYQADHLYSNGRLDTLYQTLRTLEQEAKKKTKEIDRIKSEISSEMYRLHNNVINLQGGQDKRTMHIDPGYSDTQWNGHTFSVDGYFRVQAVALGNIVAFSNPIFIVPKGSAPEAPSLTQVRLFVPVETRLDYSKICGVAKLASIGQWKPVP